MAEILVSPGIQITETDRSFVPARPLVAGAAIIGPTVKGPANVPVVVTSYGDFQRTFGTTFMLNRYKENYKEIVEEAAAAKESETVPYTKVEGEPETVYVVATELEDDGIYFTKNDSDEYVEYTNKDDEGHYIKEEGVTYYSLYQPTPTLLLKRMRKAVFTILKLMRKDRLLETTTVRRLRKFSTRKLASMTLLRPTVLLRT